MNGEEGLNDILTDKRVMVGTVVRFDKDRLIRSL